jgi:signal transduction histidine kinase
MSHRRRDIRPAAVVRHLARGGGGATVVNGLPSMPLREGAPEISTQAQSPPAAPLAPRWTAVGSIGRPRLRYVGGVLLLGGAYYGAAKLGQTLRYTASVSAIWPPAGLGIAALYLWGLRWWPGVLLGELVVNAELLLHDNTFPVGSLVGQQAGNMGEIVVGALLLRRLIGPGAALDRVEQVRGTLIALGTATALSATVGTVSMVAGGVIDVSGAGEFWRTWWLGDSSGGLVVLPLMLAWAGRPADALRRLLSWEGAALIAAVIALGVVAVSTEEPVTYLVFPALIWAAFRFGPPGATLAIAITAVVAIGVTASDVGLFFKQTIDHRTLSTQLYIGVAALTTLFLSVVVCERERSSRELADAHRHEGEHALEERRRIARDLHDSVSQALFSTVLHTRTAQKALVQEGADPGGRVASSLDTIAELTRGVQGEMRALIFSLRRDPVRNGLVAALANYVSGVGGAGAPEIRVRGPASRLPLSQGVETQLFGIGREAVANVVKHSAATAAVVKIEASPHGVLVEVRDNGRGFDTNGHHPGHFGLEFMRSRAAEIDARLTIASRPGHGTVVRVRAPVTTEPA